MISLFFLLIRPDSSNFNSPWMPTGDPRLGHEAVAFDLGGKLLGESRAQRHRRLGTQTTGKYVFEIFQICESLAIPWDGM